MNKTPYCPYCESLLKELSHDDEVEYDGYNNRVKQEIMGTCKKCNKHFLWTKIYTPTAFEQVSEF